MNIIERSSQLRVLLESY